MNVEDIVIDGIDELTLTTNKTDFVKFTYEVKAKCKTKDDQKYNKMFDTYKTILSRKYKDDKHKMNKHLLNAFLKKYNAVKCSKMVFILKKDI